jgi:hypothetical protein
MKDAEPLFVNLLTAGAATDIAPIKLADRRCHR